MLYLTESSPRSYVSIPILCWLWNGGSERLGHRPKLTQLGSRKAGGFESRLQASRALVLVRCYAAPQGCEGGQTYQNCFLCGPCVTFGVAQCSAWAGVGSLLPIKMLVFMLKGDG